MKSISVVFVATAIFSGIVFAEPKESVEPKEVRPMEMDRSAPAPAMKMHRRRASEQRMYGAPVLLDAQDYVDEQEALEKSGSADAPQEPRANEDAVY